MKKIKHGLVEQGIQLRDKREYQKAIDTFILAKKDPSLFIEACYELAYIYAGLGQRAKSRKELSEALKIEPTNPALTTLSALLYIDDGDETSAIAVLKDTIALHPGHRIAAQILLKIYRDSKDYDAEHDLLVYLLPTNKNDLGFIYSYCIFMVEISKKSNQQSFQESLTFLEKIKKDGFMEECLEYYIAKAHFRLGNYPKCIKHVDNFLIERRKQNPSAQRYMILFKVDKNDAPIFSKSVSKLEKHGDKIIIRPLDKSQADEVGLSRGPVVEL